MEKVVASRYSQALFELAQELDTLEIFKDNLMNINEIVKENENLEVILNHPEITKDDRKSIVDKIFGGLNPYMVSFLKLLVDKNRFHNMSDIYEYYIELYNEYHNIEIAYVYSANKLDEGMQSKIHALLEQKTKKHVECKYYEDKELIAGIRIRMKDEIIENSIESQLLKMKRKVSKAIV